MGMNSLSAKSNKLETLVGTPTIIIRKNQAAK
jgi:hypothetical protein